VKEADGDPRSVLSLNFEVAERVKEADGDPRCVLSLNFEVAERVKEADGDPRSVLSLTFEVAGRVKETDGDPRPQHWSSGSVQLPLLLATHACCDNCTFLNHPIRPTSGWSMSQISNAKEEFEIPLQFLFCLFPSALLFKMWFAILPPGELFSLLASHPSSTLPPSLLSFSPFPDCELFRRLSPRQVYVHKAQSVQTCLQGRPNTRQAVARHRKLHPNPLSPLLPQMSLF